MMMMMMMMIIIILDYNIWSKKSFSGRNMNPGFLFYMQAFNPLDHSDKRESELELSRTEPLRITQ